MMSTFSLIADFLHLLAVLMLLLKILANRSALGLSYKTQEMFLVVFLTRYLDVLTTPHPLSVSLLRVLFLVATVLTIFLMRCKSPIRLTYTKEQDRFPHYHLYLGSLIMAILIHRSLNPVDFMWSFSQWLEAVAILPQLFMITKLHDVENITAHYVLFLGLYRIFSLLHCVCYWQDVELTAFVAGVLQSLLYADFIYYFVVSTQTQSCIKFPV